MNTRLLLAASLAAAIPAFGADAKTGPNPEATAAFSRLKSLAGEWTAETEMGRVRLNYELIAGGTALVERFTSEKEAPMLTVYHFDGNRLMLTHYCSAGNQPRMQAGAFHPETGELEFRFLDATNLASPSAGHMHNARIRVVDKDHMVAEWQYYENGQPKFTEKAQYTRVK